MAQSDQYWISDRRSCTAASCLSAWRWRRPIFVRVLAHQSIARLGQGAGFEVVVTQSACRTSATYAASVRGDGHQIQMAGKRAGWAVPFGVISTNCKRRETSLGVLPLGAAVSRTLSVQHEQHAGLGAVVVHVDQDGAAFKQAAVASAVPDRSRRP